MCFILKMVYKERFEFQMNLCFYFYLDLNIISRHHRDTIDNLLEQLKLTLTNGISRKQADQWRRRWFRLYTYHGQL